MTIPGLTIVPAGAGSGKTYRIQTQLAEWVVKGRVAPDRIVAVTFTDAAATQLKERIRYELVKRDRIEDALKLEESYISTIHSFALRILTEFAFEGGISPSPRLLNDDEQGFLIRRTLARTDKAEPIAVNLRKFGYRWDPATNTGPEDIFLQTLLALIDRLRSLGDTGEDPRLIASAVVLLRAVYGKTGDAGTLNEALGNAVGRLLKRFPRDLSPDFEGNKAAVQAFREDYRNLRRADDPPEVASDWILWAALRKLRVQARRGAIPPGYKECAEAVMAAAAELHRHPGPLADAEIHVSALLGASQDCLKSYGEEKRRAGLVDYQDMIAGAHEILSKRPDVLAIVKDRADCMVIDEFQDTNPLQFSLLWKIHEVGVPALIVGDVKQSIMGFQNADPRLFEQLEKQYPKTSEPLTSNWRSSAPLMEWVNAVGAGLFGKRYTALAPKADIKSELAPLEVVDAPKYIRQNRARASWMAVRIKELLDDRKCRVWDKVESLPRDVRGGDVALLCPTHALVETYAVVLRALGIRTRIEREGWFSSPEVQILAHALAYLADANDRHAALYLAVTEIGSHTLESGLGVLRRGGALKDPVLDLLEPLRSGTAEMTVETVVSETIIAFDLYRRVATWPEASQARANLLRFQDVAREFGEANRQVLLAGGYYGTGLKTFLAWLTARVEENDRQPDPRVVDEEAVTISTWHSAKGLEWPIVAVCGMTREIKPRLPDITVSYEDFKDLGNILQKAHIEIVPAFVAEETKAAFEALLQPAQVEGARRLLYVALTRAREKVIVEWPSHLAGKDKAYYWNLLTEAADLRLDTDAMKVGGKVFPCVVSTAGAFVAPSVAASSEEAIAPLPVFGRRAVARRPLPTGLTPEVVTPSLLRAEDSATGANGLLEETYAGPLDADMELAGVDRGLLLHRCFEVMSGREVCMELLERFTGRKLDKEVLSHLEKAVVDFDLWLKQRFHPSRVMHEVPLLGMNSRGSVVSGVLDLLVETTEGYWILDHKSDITEDRPARFESYLPQLRCYADLIRKAFPGKPVLGVGIHWISYGDVNLLPEEGAA
jgi:ATP-dependent helicase/nuclease subunit A